MEDLLPFLVYYVMESYKFQTKLNYFQLQLSDNDKLLHNTFFGSIFVTLKKEEDRNQYNDYLVKNINDE